MLKPFSIHSTRSRRMRYFDSFCCFNFRPDVDNDVLFGVTVDYVGVDDPVKCDDSTSNGCRDIRRAFISNERSNESNRIGLPKAEKPRLKTH